MCEINRKCPGALRSLNILFADSAPREERCCEAQERAVSLTGLKKINRNGGAASFLATQFLQNKIFAFSFLKTNGMDSQKRRHSRAPLKKKLHLDIFRGRERKERACERIVVVRNTRGGYHTNNHTEGDRRGRGKDEMKSGEGRREG